MLSLLILVAKTRALIFRLSIIIDSVDQKIMFLSSSPSNKIDILLLLNKSVQLVLTVSLS